MENSRILYLILVHYIESYEGNQIGDIFIVCILRGNKIIIIRCNDGLLTINIADRKRPDSIRFLDKF